MVNCRYCDGTFSDEASYLDHLEDSHRGELTRIDRRRLAERSGGEDGGIPQIVYHAGAVVIVVLLVGGILVALSGIGQDERVHEHGEILVEIDGEPVDFDQPPYHAPERFHFHSGDPRWHMHPDRLTVEEAMEELGVPITDSSITIDGTTYEGDDSDVSVTMELNGEPLDTEAELHDGDRIVIVVETNG